MKFEVKIDPHCGDCHGKGEISFDEWKDGECWLVSVACPCVTYHHDDEMKAFLAALRKVPQYSQETTND